MTLSDVGTYAVYAFAMGWTSGIMFGVVMRVFSFFQN